MAELNEKSFSEKIDDMINQIISLLPDELDKEKSSGFESLLKSDIHDKNLLNMVATRLDGWGHKKLISTVTEKIQELFGERYDYLPIEEKYLN